MKLWIRNQDRTQLKLANNLWISTETIHNHNNFNMYEEAKIYYTIVVDGEQFAKYETKERALQVLDEVQNALVGKVIVEPKYLVKQKDKEALKEMVEEKTIVKSPAVDIKPLNQNSVVYELPEK